MGYSTYPTPDFKKHFKKLFKKYPSLKKDVDELIGILEDKPNTGSHIGHNIYKIRIAISSKGKGKSGGGRVITYMVTEDQELYLVDIYDKSQIDSISKKQIFEILKKVGLI